MYPTSKYSTRPPSPTFVNFSPPSNYPSSHHATMPMKHHMIAKDTHSHTAVTLDGRGEIIFPNDIESIEFCVQDNVVVNYPPNDAFSDRRRRGNSRRSNHKLEVEQQVKWSRKNIAATMERFEPNHKLDYNTLQTPNNHVYSYAYYEPGAAKCHTNIPTPQKELAPSTAPIPGPSKSPPRNSIRALLAKSFRSRAPTSSEERHTYTTRYGTQENLYEEVNDQKIRKVLSDNRIVSVNSTMVKEELRRVQHNHFRVLDELNLSLEALIMPSTPPDTSPASTSDMKGGPTPHCSSSMENLSSTLTSIELKDHTCINPEFDEGDLDSGFSGSGSSSGASYNESLRYYKTGAVMIPPTQANAGATTTTLPHMRSCRSSSSTSTKGSLNSDDHTSIGCIMTSSSSAASSPFNFGRRCSDTQRSATAGTKPKKHFWTIKQ
ncbi:unnamed protein product [Hermetia illucens]|uniref:Uncharacterized protein n=1 Tax=Hermetia illucens TaxID=343691 RepID=A0A7R8V0Z2_HERIL|nr:uncharacterized protein LOC119657899 [Hermetia illucens]CAD7090116.1 unnamed protein product [Hermetia illucens]